MTKTDGYDPPPTPEDDARRIPTEATHTVGILARRFVELLLAEARKAAALAAPHSHPLFTEEFGLPDEPHEDRDEPDPTLPVDEAAVAVLLAAQFERDPATLRALRRDAPVVVVQAPDARTVSTLEYVLRVCVVGRTTGIVSNGMLDHADRSGIPASDRRQAVILPCDGDKRSRGDVERRAMTALSLALPFCAVSADVGRNVPLAVRSVADRVVVLGGWSAALLGVLIEAVTGTPVDVPDAGWIAGVTLDDLRMSVSRRRGADGSLGRLRSTVGRRMSKDDDVPLVRDLHGLGEAKPVVEAMLLDLLAYRDGRIPWSAMSRGLVFAGPTGTGKTFLAKAFARSAGLPLVIGSMASWQAAGDGHLGDCLAAMKRSFAEARAAAPSVLFIDEIDSLGDRKEFHFRHRDYSSQVVNCLLEELDGAGDRVGVTVLAATNHIGRIDDAILRPGRLDRVVTIGLPDVPALCGILRTQLGADLAEADLTPVALAGRGGSGASAASWVRQARGIARRAGRDLSVDDLLAAVRDGRTVVPETERRRIALHESAHACAAMALDLGVVQGVSIHDDGGLTELRPTLRTTTRDQAVSVIVHLLAGRAAERHFLGTVSAGAGGMQTSDLALATKMAFGIEASWGLGELGPLWLGAPGEDIGALARVPGFVASARRMLLACEAEAGRLVVANEQAVLRCADRLLECGHLDAAAVASAVGPVAPFRPAVPLDPAGGRPAAA